MTKDDIELLRACEVATEHPGRGSVLRLLDSFEVSGPNGAHLCLALELLGASLLRCLPDTGTMLDNVKAVMQQVLLGLDFLHTKAGIIHTDIKPENVLVVNSGPVNLGLEFHGLKVKIVDLGSGCWTDKHFSAEIGTDQYRGPEQLVGSAEYGTSADVWASACLAFELATGRYLFAARPDSQCHSPSAPTWYAACSPIQWSLPPSRASDRMCSSRAACSSAVSTSARPPPASWHSATAASHVAGEGENR